jgi:hypothetical protein
MTEPSHKISLIDLPLPARLVLATFLITVGIGYASALVQLRVQHAAPGQTMPGPEQVRHTFFGEEGKTQLERLLTAPITEPFNGSGSMKGAFIDPARTSGLDPDIRAAVKRHKDDHKNDPDYKEMNLHDANELVLKQREGECLTLLDWLKTGADKNAYEDDGYPVSKDLGAALNVDLNEPNKEKNAKAEKKADEPWITRKWINTDENGTKTIKIRSILRNRCVRCHREESGSIAEEFPLDSYEDLMDHNRPEKSGGMSLHKLAQSTHVHMLGFAVLWCLTGLIFACTSLPAWIRAIFGPWTLIAQVADIACWWLAGQDPKFADVIMVTGGLVGVGLTVQILGSSLCLFRKGGRLVMILVLILVAIGVAGFYLKVVEPRLKNGHSLTSSLLQRDASG